MAKIDPFDAARSIFKGVGKILGEDATKTVDELVGTVDAMQDIIKSVKSNVPINKQPKVYAGKGVHGAVGHMKRGAGMNEAIKKAYSKDGKGGDGIAWGTIAASTMGVSAGYRVLSGGGVYRDKNGNANIIGVPFV